MAEPSSSAVVAGAGIVGVTAVSLWPGVDGNAVIGAFAGAIFFVVFAKELGMLARFGYFVASWIGGYYVAAEAIERGWVRTSGLVALLGALLCVTVGISLLLWLGGGKMPSWMQWVADRFGGSRNGNG
jgi:hypothetical protein